MGPRKWTKQGCKIGEETSLRSRSIPKWFKPAEDESKTKERPDGKENEEGEWIGSKTYQSDL